MNKITIVNKYHKTPNAIYCGRGSPLGNPFPMKSPEERDKVCDAYEEYFHEQMKLGNEAMRNQLISIWRLWQKEDIYLECYCAPKRCHCETIRSFLLEKANK